jgi:hypothetical protein
MGLVIRPAGAADEAALRSLYDWLSLETLHTANVKIAYGPTASDPGTLGSTLPEYLTLVPLAVGALDTLDLVAKLDSWIKSRHRKEGVVVSNSRGESVVITAGDDGTVAKVAQLLAAEDPDAGDGSPAGDEGSGHGRTP